MNSINLKLKFKLISLLDKYIFLFYSVINPNSILFLANYVWLNSIKSGYLQLKLNSWKIFDYKDGALKIDF